MEDQAPSDGDAVVPIELSPPDMSRAEFDALVEAFETNRIGTEGAALDRFETLVAERAGTEAALAVNSGTAAMHLALRVLGVVRGDTVIVPTLTPVAPANVVRYIRAVPYFVDADPHTGNVDPDLLTQTVTSLDRAGRRPAAVITVDLYGNCADYDPIRMACDHLDIPIIEDAADALGSTYRGRPAGSLGELGVFSFGDNKIATTGAGGALVGPAPFVERARHLADHARDRALHQEHSELGYAYRMTNLAAAIGVGQLGRLDRMIDRTREINSRYVDELADIDGLHIAPPTSYGRGNCCVTVVYLDQRQHPTPHEICRSLADAGVQCAPAWKPMHLQPLYADSEVAGGEVAERLYHQGLWLPSGSRMTDDEQTRVIEAVREVLHADRIADTVALDDVRDEIDQNEASSTTSEQSGDQPTPA